MIALSEFDWEIPADGFAAAAVPRDSVGSLFLTDPITRAEWLSPENQPEPDDRVVLIPRSSAPARSYRPLVEQPGLFLRFADLEDSEEAIVEFASRFGPLFRPDRYVLPPWNPEKVQRLPEGYSDLAPGQWEDLVIGTRLGWDFQIQRLRAVVDLQEAITSGDPATVDALWSRRLQADEKLLEDIDSLKSLFGPPDPSRLRRALPSLTIEGAGQGSRLEMAMALRDRALTDAFRARPNSEPVVHVQMSEGELLLVPTHLLGAIWVQLAVAIEQDKRFRRCPARDCPLLWFEVSTGPLGVREDAEFCSPRCRHTAYRDRKTSARRMRRDGVSVEDIATSLKTDVRRVRSWVAKKPR